MTLHRQARFAVLSSPRLPILFLYRECLLRILHFFQR